MCNAPADRSFVPHLNVTDKAGGISERAGLTLNDIGSFDGVMRSQGADAYFAAIFAYVRKLRKPADIDQKFRSCETQLHHRNETVAAGENFRSARVFL